jgi:hypothetical protein
MSNWRGVRGRLGGKPGVGSHPPHALLLTGIISEFHEPFNRRERLTECKAIKQQCLG